MVAEEVVFLWFMWCGYYISCIVGGGGGGGGGGSRWIPSLACVIKNFESSIKRRIGGGFCGFLLWHLLRIRRIESEITFSSWL